MILVTTWNVLILKTVSYVVFCKKNVICLPTEHQGVHKNSFRSVRAFQDRIGIWECWFLRRGENRSTRRKTSWSRAENQQQTQPTYDAGSRNQTRDTLVGGERSHHYVIPAPYQPCFTIEWSQGLLMKLRKIWRILQIKDGVIHPPRFAEFSIFYESRIQ